MLPNHMKNRIIYHFGIAFIALLLLNGYACLAQNRSERIKPKWVTHSLPESISTSYIFVRSHGEGASLVMAKQMAFISMSQRLEIERGLTVNTSVQVREHLFQNQYGSGSEYEQDIVLDVTENGHHLQIVCREIDDWWVVSNGRYCVDVLYTVADKKKYGGSYDDEIVVSANYGTSGLLSIVPSAGQFYKGDFIKGGIILAGEVIAAGGILLCEETRASYIKKMYEQPKYASQYNSLADSWQTGRNVFIGAATAIYVYNLIDAFMAPGAKQIIIKNNRYSINPIPYGDNYAIGMGMIIHF